MARKFRHRDNDRTRMTITNRSAANQANAESGGIFLTYVMPVAGNS